MIDGSNSRFLSFSLGEEEYAVPLLKVKEVIPVPEVTPVPYVPPHFMGVTNLRGQVISVIDLRLKLGMKKNGNCAQSVVIILDLNGTYIGLIVDSVNSVLNLPESEISPRPEMENSQKVKYIMGVARAGSELILLLDIEKTLDVEDVEDTKAA